MNIYVGNLTQDVNETDLRFNFEEYGTIKHVKIIKDMHSGLSKGFGFVEILEKEGGEKAIEELDKAELDGRIIAVNEAKPQRRNKSRN